MVCCHLINTILINSFNLNLKREIGLKEIVKIRIHPLCVNFKFQYQNLQKLETSSFSQVVNNIRKKAERYRGRVGRHLG